MDAELLRQTRVLMTKCLAVLLILIVGGCFLYAIPPSPPSDRKFKRLFREQREEFFAFRDAALQFKGPDYWRYESEPSYEALVEAANGLGLGLRYVYFSSRSEENPRLDAALWSVREVGTKSIVWDPGFDGRVHRSTRLWWRGDTVEARVRLEDDWFILRAWH